jgi:hypothetical protein
MAILDAAKKLAKNIGGKIADEAGDRLASGIGDKVSGAFAAKETKFVDTPEEAVADVPNSQTELTNNLANVSTIPELSAFLTDLKNRQDGESALAYALKAQLQVLTVVQHPKLSSSPFDLMLESLKLAVQRAENENQKANFQQKAAVMTNSMVFFMEAKLHYEGDKWKKEGQDILKEACEMLAESACALALAPVGGGVVAVTKKLASSLFQDILSNRGGFIKRIMDWFNKKENLAAYQAEFYSFLESAFDKLMKYKNLFGSSSILRNLVLNHKDALMERVGNKSRELHKLDPGNPVLKDKTGGRRFGYCLIGIFFIMLTVVLGVAYLFYLFNLWGGDKWVENLANSAMFVTIYTVHFGLLDHSLFIKIIIVLLGSAPAILAGIAAPHLGFSNIAAVEYHRIIGIADEYYTVLADKLDDF